MFLYLLIFFSKIIENTLSTLRIIVVANRKKRLGAILQGIVALIWIFVTGTVIIDIGKDPLKILFFCFGTIIGSYSGSILEEKISLGNNTILCIVKKYNKSKIKRKLKKYYIRLILKNGDKYSILLINSKRKNSKQIIDTIKKIEKNALIINEISNNIV